MDKQLKPEQLAGIIARAVITGVQRMDELGTDHSNFEWFKRRDDIVWSLTETTLADIRAAVTGGEDE